MNRTAYILTFDRDDNLDYKTLHGQLVKLPSVKNWWHYLSSCYIIISDQTQASALFKEIQLVLPNKRLLLTEINLNNKQGWLPKEAWDWIGKQMRQNQY